VSLRRRSPERARLQPPRRDGRTAAMTMDERLEALTLNLELLSLEAEKDDKQIAQVSSSSIKRRRGGSSLLASSRNDRESMN